LPEPAAPVPQSPVPAPVPPQQVERVADGMPVEDQPVADTTAPPEAAPSSQAAEDPAASPPPARAAGSRIPMIEFDRDSYVVSEGDGFVRLTIRRVGPVARELTFSWVLRPNTAQAGSDYADIGPGVERIPAGVREVGLSIPLVQDPIKKGTR